MIIDVQNPSDLKNGCQMWCKSGSNTEVMFPYDWNIVYWYVKLQTKLRIMKVTISDRLELSQWRIKTTQGTTFSTVCTVFKPGIFFMGHKQTEQPRCDAAERGVPSGAILFAYRNFKEMDKKWKIAPDDP